MTQGHHAHIHGLERYNEIHGSGTPLILLHGAFASTGIFAELLPQLDTPMYQLYASTAPPNSSRCWAAAGVTACETVRA